MVKQTFKQIEVQHQFDEPEAGIIYEQLVPQLQINLPDATAEDGLEFRLESDVVRIIHERKSLCVACALSLQYFAPIIMVTGQILEAVQNTDFHKFGIYISILGAFHKDLEALIKWAKEEEYE